MSNTTFSVGDIQTEKAVIKTIYALSNGEYELMARNWCHASVGTDPVATTDADWTVSDAALTSVNRQNITVNTDSITIVSGGVYSISLNAQLTSDVAAIKTVELGIGVDDADPTSVLASCRIDNNDSSATGCSGTLIVPFDSGDVLKIFVKNTDWASGTETITIASGNISIQKIGTEF